MLVWNWISASSEFPLLRRSCFRLFSMALISEAVFLFAAKLAAAGSKPILIWLNSLSRCSEEPLSVSQYNMSLSNWFQALSGVTQVPIDWRVLIMPLALSIIIASLITIRLTPYRLQSSLVLGISPPFPKWPVTIAAPSSFAIVCVRFTPDKHPPSLPKLVFNF